MNSLFKSTLSFSLLLSISNAVAGYECPEGLIPVPDFAEVTSLPERDGIYITFTNDYSYPGFKKSPQLLLEEVILDNQKVMNQIDIYSRSTSPRQGYHFEAGDSLEITRVVDNEDYFVIDFGPFTTTTPLPNVETHRVLINANNDLYIEEYTSEKMTYPKSVGEFQKLSQSSFIFCMEK